VPELATSPPKFPSTENQSAVGHFPEIISGQSQSENMLADQMCRTMGVLVWSFKKHDGAPRWVRDVDFVVTNGLVNNTRKQRICQTTNAACFVPFVWLSLCGVS
jgi:hypothetical protein